MHWQPLLLSCELAGITALLLLLAAFPIAALLAFRKFPGKALVESVVTLPLVLPPTVLGYFLLVAMGNHSPFGRWYEEMFGSPLAFSFTGLVIASMIYSLPFAVQPLQQAFAAMPREWLEQAYMLGLNGCRTVFRVLIPAVKAGMASALVLSFAHTMGEFGVVLMVGGAIPGSTRVASVALFEHVENMEYAEANALALTLLAIALATLAIANSAKKGWR